MKGVEQSTNAILHPWVKEQVEEILKTVPEKPLLDEETGYYGKSGRLDYRGELPYLRSSHPYGCC